jgi:DNA helicase HerA-like ATPase
VGEPDLRAVAAAAEWVDKSELNRIAGLPRQEAVIFGSSVAIPTRVVAPIADPLPESRDPDFSRWLVPLREEVGASAEAQVNTTEEAIEPPEGTDDDVPF